MHASERLLPPRLKAALSSNPPLSMKHFWQGTDCGTENIHLKNYGKETVK